MTRPSPKPSPTRTHHRPASQRPPLPQRPVRLHLRLHARPPRPPTAGDTTSEAELSASSLRALDDFPEGWVATPADDDDEGDAETIQAISECSGLDPVLIGDGVLGESKAESDEFESPDETAS